MNSSQQESAEGRNNQEYSVGKTFLEFLTITVRFRWFLFWFVFLITVAATSFALLTTKWYKATTSVLPAENTDFLSAFSGLSALAKSFSPSKGLAALTGSSEFDRYMAILKSSTMIDDVINKFELKKEYELEGAYYEKVVKAFIGNMELEVQDEGNLTSSIYDKNPQKAADIANYMISRLNEINTNLSVTNAKANREFIEKRYFQNVDDINQLENNMRKFQEKYGVVAVPEQLEASVKAMSGIYADLAQKEIEVKVLTRTYGENNPLTTKSKIELEEIGRKIKNLNSGKDGLNDGTNLLIPFKQAPKLSNEYLKIYRDLEIQYKILEFVQPLYEQAKVEEVRNSPSVLVLDKAVPVDRKSKPKGSLYAMVAFVSSIIIGYLIVFILVLFEKIKLYAPDKHLFISNSFRKDLKKIGINK